MIAAGYLPPVEGGELWCSTVSFGFERGPADGTLLRVAVGNKPRLAFKLARPVLPRALTLVLTRAGHNLEHGRWFSTPTSN